MKIYERSGGTIGKSWTDHSDDMGKGMGQVKPIFSDIRRLEATGAVGPYRVIEKGYTDCACNAGWTPGACMDIFGGSGTLAQAARNLRRKAILIDISEKYCRLQVKKITTGK
jgi:hypothetical protein